MIILYKRYDFYFIMLYLIYEMFDFNSSSTQLYHICIYLKIVISLVSSLSFGMLTLVYFTPYRLASALVSKNGGVGDPFAILLRFS